MHSLIVIQVRIYVRRSQPRKERTKGHHVPTCHGLDYYFPVRMRLHVLHH
jgi:hypothetical protein